MMCYVVACLGSTVWPLQYGCGFGGRIVVVVIDPYTFVPTLLGPKIANDKRKKDDR